MLLEAGAKVTLATPGFAIGEDLNVTIRVPIYQRLHAAGVQFVSNHMLDRLDGNKIVLSNVYGGHETILDDVDLIVQWSGNQVADELRHTLNENDIEFHVVGDVQAPRTMTVAMAEAAILARSI